MHPSSLRSPRRRRTFARASLTAIAVAALAAVVPATAHAASPHRGAAALTNGAEYQIASAFTTFGDRCLTGTPGGLAQLELCHRRGKGSFANQVWVASTDGDRFTLLNKATQMYLVGWKPSGQIAGQPTAGTYPSWTSPLSNPFYTARGSMTLQAARWPSTESWVRYQIEFEDFANGQFTGSGQVLAWGENRTYPNKAWQQSASDSPRSYWRFRTPAN